MKLYIYYGLDNEKVPKDVTHAIVNVSVTVIKKSAFDERVHLMSIILGANVKRIEEYAFSWCVALRVIVLPFESFNFPRHWNTLKILLSVVVNLWKLCFSHRL